MNISLKFGKEEKQVWPTFWYNKIIQQSCSTWASALTEVFWCAFTILIEMWLRPKKKCRKGLIWLLLMEGEKKLYKEKDNSQSQRSTLHHKREASEAWSILRSMHKYSLYYSLYGASVWDIAFSWFFHFRSMTWKRCKWGFCNINNPPPAWKISKWV